MGKTYGMEDIAQLFSKYPRFNKNKPLHCNVLFLPGEGYQKELPSTVDLGSILVGALQPPCLWWLKMHWL